MTRMQKYCGYQDRCHHEVRYKLVNIGIYGDDLEDIIASLVNDKYLDEERFVKAYTQGKFRNNKWGMTRIVQGLKAKRIGDYLIQKAKAEIDPKEYEVQLVELLKKKEASLSNKTRNPYQSLFNYAYSKGYESGLISEVLRQMFQS